jgi:hypothetical protein
MGPDLSPIYIYIYMKGTAGCTHHQSNKSTRLSVHLLSCSRNSDDKKQPGKEAQDKTWAAAGACLVNWCAPLIPFVILF